MLTKGVKKGGMGWMDRRVKRVGSSVMSMDHG
jgi:hypothetical protein